MEPLREYIRFYIYTLVLNSVSEQGLSMRRACDGLWGPFTFFSHSCQMDSTFYWCQSERALKMKHVLGGHANFCDRQFCGESRVLLLGVSYGSALYVLSSMSSLVGPRGAQDWSPTSWQQNRKNKGWQSSAAIGFKNVNQMALRGFLMLLRVTKVGLPSSLWKINVLTWCGWPKMNLARRSWKQVAVQERECSSFSLILRDLLLWT